MNPRFFACVAVVLLACVAVVATPAAAQDNGTAIEINTTASNDEPESYAQEIDSNTRLVSWEYNDERDGFELRFEADRSTRITLTEAVQFSEGAGSGRIYQERIPRGTTDVFVKVPRRGGQAAVTMTTRESINNNQFSYVSTGEAQIDRAPISYDRAQLIVFLTAVGSAGGAFGIIKRRRENEEKDWEKIL